MTRNGSFRLASLAGKRAAGVISRTMVYAMCFTLVLSGLIPPGLGQAQILRKPLSLKEVPVPVPMAVCKPAPITNIPGPNVNLVFRPLTYQIVKNQAALIRLGKALFWDMQVGSDGVTACASCHFHAGADNRSKNQLSPGLKDTNFLNNPLGGTGDTFFGNSTVPFTANDPLSPNPSQPPDPAVNVPGNPGLGPNVQLSPLDFPFNEWADTTALVPRGPGVTFVEEFAQVPQDINDVCSSQGVRRTLFNGVTPGVDVDRGTPLADVFNTVSPGTLQLAGKMRRVEPRNSPTVFNGIYNFDTFWDGRASYVFNGVNPFGFRDRVSTLKANSPTLGLLDYYVRVINSSLASQSVGPPLSDFEMSWDGRQFPDIGKKLLTMRPLAKQLVHPQDSVLANQARAVLSQGGVVFGLKGLYVNTYADMVKAAFQDHWWNSADIITVLPGTAVTQKASANDPRSMGLSPGQTKVEKAVPGVDLADNQYTQMMFNFSLFWGLAIQAYEATLISDDTPFDRFMGAPSLGIAGNPVALNDQQRLGFSIFESQGQFGARCVNCHVNPITTSHTILGNAPNDQGVPDLGLGEAIETMVMGNGQSANYDHGMYNIAARRTTEDLGRAGTAPNAPPFLNPLNNNQPFPLSLVELTALREQGKLPPDVARFIPNVPMLPLRITRGAFKTPNLRNSKFTGPYLHTGDSATLRQVAEFYTRGGNFPNTNFADLTADMIGVPPLVSPNVIPSARKNMEALVAFVAEGLTDTRVAFEMAPFDHPELFVPNGAPDNDPTADIMIPIPPIGKKGRTTPLPTFLNLNPQDQ